MDSTIAIQSKIRHDALVMQDVAKDLSRWESSIKGKDENIKKNQISDKVIPLPRNNNTAPVRRQVSKHTVTHSSTAHNPTIAEQENKRPELKKSSTADGHTYDKGYSRWEKFNVEKALQEVDEADTSSGNAENLNEENLNEAPLPEASAPKVVTPASIISPNALPTRPKPSAVRKPARGKPTLHVPRDASEKQKGNEYYSKGEFSQAVKCYSRAISFNPSNHILHSNRAMAYLKLKEYRKAEEDCTTALELSEEHVKSLTRRGTARNHLGKHRLAVLDFRRALSLEPSNKQARSDFRKTRELIKASIRRAPRVNVPVKVEVQVLETENSDLSHGTLTQVPANLNGAEDRIQIQNAQVSLEENPDTTKKQHDKDAESNTPFAGQLKSSLGTETISLSNPSSSTDQTTDESETSKSYQVPGAVSTTRTADQTITDTKKPESTVTSHDTKTRKNTVVSSSKASDDPANTSSDRPGYGTKAKLTTDSNVVSSATLGLLSTTPKTSYEFLRAWRSLKSKSISPFDRVQFLTKTIGPSRISKLLESILETDIIVDIATCIVDATDKGSAVSCCLILEQISRIDSFSMNIMFFGKKEKLLMNGVISFLNEAGVETSQVEAVAKRYGVDC